MAKQQGSDKAPSFWNNVWSDPKGNENTGKFKFISLIKGSGKEGVSITVLLNFLFGRVIDVDVKERAARAAAAARRWREYSRKGVDKRPTYKLPEAISNKE